MKKKPMSAISLKSRGKNIQAARELAFAALKQNINLNRL